MRHDATLPAGFRSVLGVLAGLWCGIACSCTTPKLSPAQQIADAPSPASLHAFDGATGERLSWFAVMLRVAQSNAVFVGETHDDASGHRVEQELVNAFLLAHPTGTVSLEMLERNEQAKVDGYLRGEITLDVFLDETGSRNWAGEGSWIPWYQPMIDSARLSGGSVCAANAPRKYVSQARLDGYEPLLALSGEERALFEIDPAITRDGDWDRLKKLMATMYADHARADGSIAEQPTDEDVDEIHRAQRVWDRTMGTSAAVAFGRTRAVIHIAGGFHLEERLGTVTQFARLCADAKILVISLQPSDSDCVELTAVKGADIVIHTTSAANK